MESELSSHNTDDSTAEMVEAFTSIATPAEPISLAVLDAIRQPATVAVNEILVRLTAQAL